MNARNSWILFWVALACGLVAVGGAIGRPTPLSADETRLVGAWQAKLFGQTLVFNADRTCLIFSEPMAYEIDGSRLHWGKWRVEYDQIVIESREDCTWQDALRPPYVERFKFKFDPNGAKIIFDKCDYPVNEFDYLKRPAREFDDDRPSGSG